MKAAVLYASEPFLRNYIQRMAPTPEPARSRDGGLVGIPTLTGSIPMLRDHNGKLYRR